ncbi:hypothetical protein AK88_00382 [Plasmodium fragile]|uniref:Uncharacterized protein n=1 Tax=Plasmodium fragile TaxID=5857 RepID=A0A0D9QU77_PLAFR|nr:uncharacterized protein AK88_00382 [Plasmodium fragile]KJP89926.1 hypothetical protein AK88_00382 [Plasmodium fragile]
MNSYKKHSLSFYVLDAAACGGDFSSLWRDLEFAPREDIVIISIKNDSRNDNHLRRAIKAKLEQRSCRHGEHMFCDAQNHYEVVDPNFQFEGNSFILMVRKELRNDIRQVQCKSVKLRMRRCHGKSYFKTMRHYFDHFITHTPPLGGDNSLEQVGMAKRMVKRVPKRSGASQATPRHSLRRARCRSEGTNGCVDMEEQGDRKGKKKRHDDNVVTYITFTFTGVTLCVCLSNFDLEKHVERCEYYRCLLGGGTRGGSIQRGYLPTETRSNYAQVFLENYRLCCKQMYNHFTSSILFETEKEDLHLFNMDIVILQGFNQLILFNHLGESNLNNDSLIWGNNFAILNKSEKNLLQKKSYFTLTCSGKNTEFVSFGFKFCCDLFSQMEVSIVDDFFLSHNGEANRGEAGHMHIGVKPEVLELGPVYTYQVCQASFQLDYVHAGGGMGQDCEKGGDHLSFSILCFDPRSQSTIPINLYSYLHLKKNSIFKYLEENVRFGHSQLRGKRKGCCPSPADEQNSVDMVRHVYVHPHKGIVKQNEQKKIKLNIYVDHMLKKGEMVKGSFILIIRFHKCGKDIKQIFFTCRYSLVDNIVSALVQDKHPLVRTPWSNRSTRRDRSACIKKCTTVKTNMSLHNRDKRHGLRNCKLTKRLNVEEEEKRGRRPFLPVNITKFVLYSFFAIDRYEQELLSGVANHPPEGILPSQEEDQPLYPLGLSNLRTDHLVYCFIPTSSLQGEEKKGVECNLNYNWKKHFFCVQYPYQYIEENFFLQSRILQMNLRRQHVEGVPLEVHYLVGKLQNNGKVEKPICVGSILFLWEELFKVLSPPLGTFAKMTQMIIRIYNKPKLKQKRKMNLIFRIIVKKSPSLLYKNIFLILLSFLKKLYFYLLFLHAFHFFHVSFLSYVTHFYLTFMDHQIGLDLVHHLLFNG